MRFVLDNSVLVAWVFDERSEYADAVGSGLVEGRAVVPSVWPLEFSNVLLVAERRGRMTEAEVTRIRDHVLGLPIDVVTDHGPRVMTEVLALARKHDLTVYDASYLDLAMREGLPLASLDKRLVEATRRCGVALVETRDQDRGLQIADLGVQLDLAVRASQTSSSRRWYSEASPSSVRSLSRTWSA